MVEVGADLGLALPRLMLSVIQREMQETSPFQPYSSLPNTKVEGFISLLKVATAIVHGVCEEDTTKVGF